MKVTVEISEKDLKDVCRFTGEKKKGPAIRKMVSDSLMLERRRVIARKFVRGEWGGEIEGLEESRAADRAASRALAKSWTE